MKKYLLVLAAGIFGILTANAWTVSFSTDENGTVATITSENPNSNNWGDIKYPTGVTNGAEQLLAANTLKFVATDATAITSLQAFQSGGFAATTVDFSGAVFAETEVETINYDGWDLVNNVALPNQSVKRTSNCMTFKYFANVENAVLANVKTLCAACFQNNDKLTTTFTIPSSVEFIEKLAVDNVPLTSIIIPKTVKYIEEKGFQNSSIANLIDVTVQGSTYAEFGAFDKEITVGQTVAGKQIYASLHFPEGAEAYFTNPNHELSVETSLNLGFFQKWLGDHYDVASNGWQQFINSAPGNGDPVPADNPIILRTFSDNVAHYVPVCYRAYIVNGISGNDAAGYTLDLVETFAIPANTGVIIYGEAETGSFALPILSGASWNTTPYTRETTTTVKVDNEIISLKNYLVANCNLPSGTKIGPYELGSDGKVAERNFVLGPYSKTDIYESQYADYMAFFRVKNITPGKNKAHLKLPSTLFKNPKGVELIPVNPSTFRATEWPKVYPGNWGTKTSPVYAKSFGEPFEDEYIPTGITNVKNENADNAAIYTLQGVKVSNNPTKGVYIQNGKKFIVK